jgi:hypothetical protein
MNVVILQPSYIPWRGFFHQIYKADLFIFYDDVKYDKNGWRNRNRIKTANGTQWLTIPVHTGGVESHHTPICEIHNDWARPWNQIHWTTLKQAYGKAPFFEKYAPILEPYYQQKPEFLADFIIALTIALSQALGNDHTRFLRSRDLEDIHGTKTSRLIEILTRVGATHYISGPSARDYIETDLFREAGITLEYMTYEYSPYPQIYPPYEPQVSILDLLFMTGPDALNYILQKNYPIPNPISENQDDFQSEP